MRALTAELRRGLERSVLEGRRAAELGVRSALGSLGVEAREKPSHLSEEQARLRRGLRAKQRQLGGGFELLVWECAYEQWHRLLFARYLAENGLLLHPVYEAPVTLAECEDLAEELGELDGWSVAARFAAEILPGIFRLDDPAVQVRLAAEHRLALEQIVAGLPSEVFLADDSLGWVYQYWQSERKAQVNASEVKIGGADLAPVTQLFTENYMVRFLLENSLGAWWAVRHPDSPLVQQFEYLRFDENGKPAAGAFEGWPATTAEVTVMDPCCGSGHFLVEAFGMLWRMRAEEEGLDPITAQDAVLEDSLFGLELDPRCVQIAMFAVALTAWKQGGGWRSLPTPNIACSGIPAKAPLKEWTELASGDQRLERTLGQLHALFKDADTLGSLIDPRRVAEMASPSGAQRSFDDVDFDEVAPLLEKAAARETNDPATAVLGAHAAGIARAAILLSRAYTLVVTNPPYLSRGKQASQIREASERIGASAKPDLATTFMSRCRNDGQSIAMITPQAWLMQPRYLTFRSTILTETSWCLVGRLGHSAFTSFGGVVVNVLAGIWNARSPGPDHLIAVADAQESGMSSKDAALRDCQLLWVSQQAQLDHPTGVVALKPWENVPILEEYAEGLGGITTGDSPRFRRCFWELDRIAQGWARQQSTPDETKPYTGRELVLLWEDGQGELVRIAAEGGATIAGRGAWGRNGVAVQKMGDLPVTIYRGELYENVAVVVVPADEQDVPAVWSFARSGELSKEVRKLDQSVGVTCNTMVKVPFDIDRWRAVAEEEFPQGLPEPWSDDPTQWLFEGRPEVSTEPLQVGVGRLVGYRWPEQPEEDGLEDHADGDGIVCLPAVGGEAPAADRLSLLLGDAYGDRWSTGLAGELLEQTGSRKKALADWLRDDFFKQHCKVFGNRPFVWHIWDGRKDGFAALVNYHRLDHAGLEKLTYTYLGDWIERQHAGAADGVAGADVRLAAALGLRGKLEAILVGEPPFDIYVRWKSFAEQPIGWDPDLDDGVRLNIRPFVEAGVLRSKVNVHWRKDRGKNPDGSARHNDLHYTNDQKRHARQQAGTT